MALPIKKIENDFRKNLEVPFRKFMEMFFVAKRSEKEGLSPGTLVHLGEKPAEPVRITLYDYDEAHLEAHEVSNIEECYVYKDKPTTTWINVEGVHQADIIEKLGSHYGLHPLLLEDIMNTEQRPKIEDFEDYVFLVLKALYMEDAQLQTEQVCVILGKNFVISFQESRDSVFHTIRERLKNGKGRIRRMGADYLAYTLLDAVVDGYFYILEAIGEKIEAAELELMTAPTRATMERIYGLKREILFLRKAIWPLRELIGNLKKLESRLFKKATAIYLRDVYDHINAVGETVSTFVETISDMQEIYLGSLNTRLNATMKVLTVVTTIFIPLTFITGVYGMNFPDLPGLNTPGAYLSVWALMAALGVGMYLYFRRSKML